MNVRCKYEYNVDCFAKKHIWSVVCGGGALHLWINDMGEKFGHDHPGQRYHGGLEIHYRTPPGYMRHDAPSQDECWLLHAPCWHDGSSLQASETWIPRWKARPHDHDDLFAALTKDAEGRFTEDD